MVKFVGYGAEASAIPLSHPIVETLSRNFTEVSGEKPEIGGRQGAAGTRFLNLYAKTPTAIFGPGSAAAIHSDNEYLAIAGYTTAIKVVALSICDWCGVEQQPGGSV